MTTRSEGIKLEDLGYDESFESKRRELGFEDFPPARVVAEHRGSYRVKNENGEFLAKITGKQIFDAERREDYPAVGDWVAIEEIDDEKAVTKSILPRRTILKKKYSNKKDSQIIATNIDTAFIIESLDKDYNLNRFERYIVLAREGGVVPVIVLNKIDLVDQEELSERMSEVKKRFPEVEVLTVSAITKDGLGDLAHYMVRYKTYCFLGSSGVGKSSMINALLSGGEIKTQEISKLTGKGKHTTTARQMYFLPGGAMVIDNPGTREVGMADAESGIADVFDEISAMSGGCKFADCTHMSEPGCAVLEAKARKKLEEEKYQNYLKLKKENEYFEMTSNEKRQKDRKFGKFVKKALEQIEKYK